MVDDLAREYGLLQFVGMVQYFEVDTITRQNMTFFGEVFTRYLLGQPWMGEAISKSTQLLFNHVFSLTHGKEPRPIMTLTELNAVVGNLDFLKTGLDLLSLWGVCTYYPSPPDLGAVAILNPSEIYKLLPRPARPGQVISGTRQAWVDQAL